MGRDPYAEIEDRKILFPHISRGYRMGKPEFATSEIYKIMIDCWEKIPEKRPLFNQLKNRFERILNQTENDVKIINLFLNS